MVCGDFEYAPADGSEAIRVPGRLYYSGLRDPFPYNWSLMMRALPKAQAELRSMLAAPDRPTWIVR